MNLTKNFTLAELIESNNAKIKKIDNTPSQEVINNLTLLAVNVLQPIRDEFGPLIINCGYRCPKLNRVVGGAFNSEHVTGNAADIDSNNNGEIFKWIRENLTFRQLIWENGDDENPAWIHVSFNHNDNKKQVLRLKQGKYIVI